MANENRLQKDVKDLEDYICKKNATKMDKFLDGLVIGSVLLATASVVVPLLAVGLSINIFPTLGIIGGVLTFVKDVSLLTASFAFMNRILKGTMNISMGNLKKRCIDEVNINVIEKLSNKLVKETIIMLNATNLNLDSSIVKNSFKDFENLLNLIKDKYNEMKVKPEELGVAIRDLEEATVDLVRLGKDTAVNKLYNEVAKIQVIAHSYCAKDGVRKKEQYQNSYVQRERGDFDNKNNGPERHKANVAKKVTFLDEREISQSMSEKQSMPKKQSMPEKQNMHSEGQGPEKGL